MAKNQKCTRLLCPTNFCESHQTAMWVIHRGWPFMLDAECIYWNFPWIHKSVHCGLAAMAMPLGKVTKGQ